MLFLEIPIYNNHQTASFAVYSLCYWALCPSVFKYLKIKLCFFMVWVIEHCVPDLCDLFQTRCDFFVVQVLPLLLNFILPCWNENSIQMNKERKQTLKTKKDLWIWIEEKLTEIHENTKNASARKLKLHRKTYIKLLAKKDLQIIFKKCNNIFWIFKMFFAV